MKQPASIQEVPRISELKPVAKAHPELKDLYATVGSLEWGIKRYKDDYVAGGALYLIAGRLLLHPAAFRRVTLEIGRRVLAERHCRNEAPPA